MLSYTAPAEDTRKMEIRFRKHRRIAILLLMIAVTAGIGFRYNAKDRYFLTEYMKQSTDSDGEFELSVWINRNLVIEWWKNEQDGCRYLFIPGAMEGRKLNLTFPNAEFIRIDGQKVTNGEKYRFTQGSHILSADNGIYELEVLFTSSVASLFFETESGTLDTIHASKDNAESGQLSILDSRGHKYFEGDVAEIHCRGNSSFEETEKKSYTLKLDRKADLFGMGSAKKWILTANAFDDTLLRNTTAFSIAKLLKLAYTPDTQYVDVYANGSFIGNYLLSEKPEVGRNRVNVRDLEEEVKILNDGMNPGTMEFFMVQQGRLFSIKGCRIENEPDDVSGGYLLELDSSDRYGLEASGFLTSRMQPVVFASPKYASYDQVSYVAGLYQDFEDALFAEDGYSPYTRNAYSDYIDTDSFARKYLLEELVKNLDASFTSQYLYKYDDSISSKFYAGPCWDYDKSIAAYGITEDGIDLHDPAGLYAAVQKKDSDIWYALYRHADFRQEVTDIFFRELEPQLRAHAADLIHSYHSMIEKSNDCNMLRWNTFPQSEGLAEKQEMHDRKVEELVVFIDKRLDFLESEWRY